ncbi:hypothetical protein TruAng_003767 [Truncatella angustata]|nr:hypothetical protein TruAng_003767 [Truncatella angustata]
MVAVSIPKGLINLAGLLFKPSTPSAKSPALVVVHPGGGVKEQTASLYAKKLSEQGFVAIAYDASNQGESGGEAHHLEDPNQRTSDVWAVVDYLESLDFVDASRISALGICAGGGYAVAATKADHRIQAVATVSMVNIGDSVRHGWLGNENPSKHEPTLKQIAQQIRAENKGAEPACGPYVPPNIDETTTHDMAQAHEYYRTPRAQHPRSENRMLLRSLPLLLNYDAFHLADLYLKQPVLMVVGENAESKWNSDKLHKILGGSSKLISIPKGGHMDLYDKEPFVGVAVEKIVEFLNPKTV